MGMVLNFSVLWEYFPLFFELDLIFFFGRRDRAWESGGDAGSLLPRCSASMCVQSTLALVDIHLRQGRILEQQQAPVSAWSQMGS